MTDDRPRIDRREALKKAALVGGALWIAPAIQSVNMTKALAHVQQSAMICTRFRVEQNRSTWKKDDGKCTSVGGTCLPSDAYAQSCGALSSISGIKAPNGSEWKIPLDRGCLVQGVALKAYTYCLFSPMVAGSNPPRGMPVYSSSVKWDGWYQDRYGYLHIPQMVRKSDRRKKDTSFVDIIVCCPPAR